MLNLQLMNVLLATFHCLSNVKKMYIFAVYIFPFSNIKYINPKDSITSYQSGYNIGFETNFNNLYGGLTFQQRGSKMEFEKTQKFEIKYNYISFHFLKLILTFEV